MTPRILIVEDDRDYRECLITIFRREGYACESCDNGERAVEAMGDGGRHDLMVLDLNLPGMNGAQVAHEARERGASMPIIALSAVHQLWDFEDLLDCGVTKLLAKPIANSALLKVVRNTLRG